jgi:diaminopimelate decarboxylase
MSAVEERIDDCLSVRGGRLAIEELDAGELAARFGTPLYVVSEDQLRRNARRYRAAFAERWPGPFRLLPSIKANSCLALRRILTEEGVGCDTFGPGELEAALRSGVPPEEISLNGPMKDSELLERAVARGVRITLDSVVELELARDAARRVGKPAHVRFRIRPDLVGFDEPSEMSAAPISIRLAVHRYKAGIPTEDLLAVDPALIRDPDLDVAGIMLHFGRHGPDPRIWAAAVDSMAQILAELDRAWGGWKPREFDIGGGYPSPRDPVARTLEIRADAPAQSPPAEDYAEAICNRLSERLLEAGIDPGQSLLEVEPGRAMYADAGIHLATVRHVKRQTEPVAQTWVETDSSDAYLGDVNLEHNLWTCLPVARPLAERVLTADVTGRTCAADIIIPDAELPEVGAGDVVAFLDTGAYQEVTATNFNALPRPGTVLVHGAEAETIRRAETIADVFARDVVPKRLEGTGADGNGARADGAWRARGLDHVSVTSGDIDRSLGFYCDLLGLELRDRGEAMGVDELEIVGLPDASVRWADIELPHGQVVELIEYMTPRGEPLAANINDPGAFHISFRVDDVDAVHRRLVEAGVAVRSDPVEVTEEGAWNGARCFYATDPDGVTVELIEQAGSEAGGG